MLARRFLQVAGAQTDERSAGNARRPPSSTRRPGPWLLDVRVNRKFKAKVGSSSRTCPRPPQPDPSIPPLCVTAASPPSRGSSSRHRSSGATDVPTLTNATLRAPLCGPAAAGRPETRTLPGCPKARWPPASILAAEVKPGPACARPSPGCPHLAWLLGPCPTVALNPPPAGPRRAGFRRRHSGRSPSPPRPPPSAPLPRPTPAPAAAVAAGARMRRRETAGGAAQMDPTWRRRA